MKPSDHHLAAAHLWIFNSGIDPTCVDVAGRPLVESLASQFAQFEHDGKLEAASHVVKQVQNIKSDVFKKTSECTPEDTGTYKLNDLTKLLAACGEKL